MNFSVRFTNQDAILRSMGILEKELQQAYAEQLHKSAEEVMTAAKELTPVDTGALRASGHVQPPAIQGGHVSVTMGFGGPAAEYAEIVHEDLSAQHAVGQAKFLEQPLLARRGEIQQALDEALTAAMRKAGL